jgi:hypothetical protein
MLLLLLLQGSMSCCCCCCCCRDRCHVVVVVVVAGIDVMLLLLLLLLLQGSMSCCCCCCCCCCCRCCCCWMAGIDAVIVGADRVVANGDTANKVVGPYCWPLFAGCWPMPTSGPLPPPIPARPLSSRHTDISRNVIGVDGGV